MEHSWPWTSHSGARSPRSTAATVNGAALPQARRDKEAKCAELVASERCRLVVVALETWHLLGDAQRFWRGGRGGQGCCQSRVPGHPRLCWLRVTPTLGQALMCRRLISTISTVRGEAFRQLLTGG